MKVAWLVLIVTALTDFTLTFATGLSTAMATSHEVGLPGWPTIIVAACGGLIVASRTIQGALRATPINTAALKGEEAPVVIPAKTVTRMAEARMVIAPTVPGVPIVPVPIHAEEKP